MVAGSFFLLLPPLCLSFPHTACVATSFLFICSGLRLQTKEVMGAFKAPKALVLGAVVILGLTPLLALLLVKVPLAVQEFSSGLAVFSVVPTTMASGVVLTCQAHGNVALAMLLAVGTNLLGVFTAPYWLKLVLPTSGDKSLDATALLVKLLLTILLPTFVGKLLQQWKPADDFAKRHKVGMKVTSSVLLCIIPWQKVGKAAGQLHVLSVGQAAELLGLGVAIRVLYLIVCTLLAAVMRVTGEEKTAFVIQGTMKTFGIAVAIIGFLDEDAVGDTGLMAIPIIIAHIVQVFGKWRGGANCLAWGFHHSPPPPLLSSPCLRQGWLHTLHGLQGGWKQLV
jgi:solute carrier family 10 (sodium/bile acid cotransporter), member 7